MGGKNSRTINVFLSHISQQNSASGIWLALENERRVNLCIEEKFDQVCQINFNWHNSILCLYGGLHVVNLEYCLCAPSINVVNKVFTANLMNTDINNLSVEDWIRVIKLQRIALASLRLWSGLVKRQNQTTGTNSLPNSSKWANSRFNKTKHQFFTFKLRQQLIFWFHFPNWIISHFKIEIKLCYLFIRSTFIATSSH